MDLRPASQQLASKVGETLPLSHHLFLANSTFHDDDDDDLHSDDDDDDSPPSCKSASFLGTT